MSFVEETLEEMFQSPRSGKFVSDALQYLTIKKITRLFQSPRSGKFVSDLAYPVFTTTLASVVSIP